MKHFFVTEFLMTLCLLLLAAQPQAQSLAGDALVDALKQGGLVLLMRHTSSPRELPDSTTVNSDNVNGERQLDEKGRRDAAAIGDALRRLNIPVGEVLSSPTYRALQTAQLAGLNTVTVQQELSNEGMAEAGAQYADWLKTQTTNVPQQGNRLLITHGPNINAAFAEAAAGMEEGDMLVIDPQSDAGSGIVARIKSSDWPGL